MRRTVRRSAGFAAGLTVVALALASCGSDGSDSTSESPESSAPSADDQGDDQGEESPSSAGDTSEEGVKPDATQGQEKEELLIGFANIGAPTSPVLKAIDEGMKAEAAKRGWDIITLNNDRSGATAPANADTMITKGVDIAVEFQGDATVAPQIMQKFDSADIPVVAMDIAHPGAYFFGVNNVESGKLSGHALGTYAKDNWNCGPDLVMLLENQDSGTVNDLRMDGIEQGVLDICPDISKDKIQRRQAGATPDSAQPVARDILAANPNMHKILVSGLNDNVAVGAINAADQLGRSKDIYAYGLGADLLLSDANSPGLAGSTAFWLEGYPLEVYKLLDKIAAGDPPTVVDDPTSDDANFVPNCQVSAAEAKDIPPMEDRITDMYGSDPTVATSAAETWCPADSDSESYRLDR